MTDFNIDAERDPLLECKECKNTVQPTMRDIRTSNQRYMDEIGSYGGEWRGPVIRLFCPICDKELHDND